MGVNLFMTSGFADIKAMQRQSNNPKIISPVT